MDYEKKYKEALERAKKLQETCDSTAVVGWCEYIFPELKESEDEKVRKAIIAILSNYVDNSNTFKPKMLAWLEKQGEQKVSVVEFNAKDWYVSKVDGKIYNAKFMKKKLY